MGGTGVTAERSPALPTTLTTWREQVVITMTFLSCLRPTRDAATTRVENDYFGFSFSKQKNELLLCVAKFALALDNCLV